MPNVPHRMVKYEEMDFPMRRCICGHPQSDHRDMNQQFGVGDCWNCENENAYGAHDRLCNGFRDEESAT